MCGISGIFNNELLSIGDLDNKLRLMNKIQKHRGPDDDNIWLHQNEFIGFGHVRLSIIDLKSGQQPLKDKFCTIVLNGEIYNYIELKDELRDYQFKTDSDTEVVLAAYQKWGETCVDHFRGMFAFVIWDELRQKLFVARDRFGIKPFYYFLENNIFYFASEIKTLLPFISKKDINLDGLNDYFTFQYTIGENTLFKNIKQLLPAHCMTINGKEIKIKKYWNLTYSFDHNHTKLYFQNRLEELLDTSIKYHLRSDIPVGAYLSGGIDSSLISILATKYQSSFIDTFTGKFSFDEKYDESKYAKIVSEKYDYNYYDIDITSKDFIDNIYKIIYHLDQPTAGIGSFPQYMVSKLAADHVRVVLGGQGGDEIFGGYVRYLIAYFELYNMHIHIQK